MAYLSPELRKWMSEDVSSLLHEVSRVNFTHLTRTVRPSIHAVKLTKLSVKVYDPNLGRSTLLLCTHLSKGKAFASLIDLKTQASLHCDVSYLLPRVLTIY